jgi:RNA polymerase sigma factor (sigma-70 family)
MIELRMKKLNNEEIIRGILDHNKDILRYIYEENYKSIVNHVVTNTGNIYDAEDLFQDCLLTIYNKIKNENLNLFVAFSTYFFAVAKKLWLRELDRRSRTNTSYGVNNEMADDFDVISNFVKIEKHKLIWKYFYKLNDKCQKVIQLFLDGHSISEVAGIMKFSSEQEVKNQRLKCKNILISHIYNDPLYKELKNESIKSISHIPRW